MMFGALGDGDAAILFCGGDVMIMLLWSGDFGPMLLCRGEEVRLFWRGDGGLMLLCCGEGALMLFSGGDLIVFCGEGWLLLSVAIGAELFGTFCVVGSWAIGMSAFFSARDPVLCEKLTFLSIIGFCFIWKKPGAVILWDLLY